MEVGNLIKILTMVTLLGGSSLASASYSFIIRPFKIFTCELMLQGPVKDLSSKENVLPVVRDALYKVKGQSPSSANEGTSYSNIVYSGPLSRLDDKKAAAIIQRLNGIEENLTATNLDAQIVSLEIRGDDIRKALAGMEAREAELQEIYNSQRDKLYPPVSRIALGVLNLMMISATYKLSGDTATGLLHLNFDTIGGLLFSGLTLINNLNVGRTALKYNLERFDWNFLALKTFLNKLTQSESPDDFFIASSKLEIPVEFHKMLMSDDGSSPELPREIGLERWGGPHFAWIFRRLINGELFNLSRTVRNAGDNERNAYIDHILFYDEVAKEPVWLFFYRAFRKQPTGRKPNKPKPSETQEEMQWAPGLTPSPVPAQNRSN